MTDLMIRDVRPLGGEPVDVLIEDGLIARIAPGLTHLPPPPSSMVMTPFSFLVLSKDMPTWTRPFGAGPGIVTMSDQHEPTASRTNVTIVAMARTTRRPLAVPRASLYRQRHHADAHPRGHRYRIGLRHLHATMRTRQTLAGSLDMQIVAFPQSASSAGRERWS